MVLLHLVIDNGHRPAEGLVDVVQKPILWVKDAVLHADGGVNGGGYDGLDYGRVRGGRSDAVALAVDAGRIDDVGIRLLEVFRIILVLFPYLSVEGSGLVQRVQPRLAIGIQNDRINEGVVGLVSGPAAHTRLSQPGERNGEGGYRERMKLLELLEHPEHNQVVLEGLGHLVAEDRQAGHGEEQLSHFGVIQQRLDRDVAVEEAQSHQRHNIFGRHNRHVDQLGVLDGVDCSRP